MDYQTLTEVLGQSKAGATPAPSLNDIIAGIQSQYQAVPSMPVQSGLYGANRYVSGTPQFGAIEVLPEYGMASQLAGPRFIPSEFNRDIYGNIDTQGLSNLISTISNDYGSSDNGSNNSGFNTSTAGSSAPSVGASTGIGGFSIGPNGMATPNTVNQGLATIGGMAVGLPLGLVAQLNNIAANNATQGFNAAIGDTMGVNANNTSPAAISANAAASGMSGVTGGTAAAAGAAAAAAAAASGMSAEAQGAAAQAAADATIGGASPSAAAAAAASAAAAADNGNAAEGGNTAANAAAVAASESSSSGGGGGTKIICTKLHELGLMPKSIYEADQAFGKKLVNESPETYEGYVRWAKHVVELMSRNDLLGKTAVFCAYHIATPWSLAMAEEMGQPVKASWFGKFLMKRGLQLCKLIGSGSKQTVTA